MKTVKYKKAPKLKIHRYVVACIYVGCVTRTKYIYAANLKEVAQCLKDGADLYDVMEVYKADHTFVKAYRGL